MYINEVVRNLQISIIRQISARMPEFKNGINMTIGEPGNDLPYELKKYMSDVTLNEKIGYTNTGGAIAYREAVAKYYNKLYGSNYTWKNALANAGSTEGISSFLRTVLKPGDEVILPTPTYPGYEPNILLMNAKPVYIDLKHTDFELTADILEQYITPRTKVIILTYPNNPTGTVMALEEMDKVAELLRKHNIYLLSDEIYSVLSFEKYNSFARYTDLIDKIVVINGFSKSHSMTGYRVAYTLASEDVINNMNKVGQYTMTGVNTVGQLGAIYACENIPTRDDVVEINKAKLNRMMKGLREIGFKVIEPKGAFYLFVDYSMFSNKKSLDFALDVLEKTELGVVPGICFNVEGYFRLSVTQSDDIIDEAINRLKTYVENECK
ncbi:pyridoxal phosphate-dependent aminotransferase [Streptobacillus moniliformis]|uniref:Aminotransferase n=1 Tax=Streptobacillus moniliformis (strain ATCC 14647 / DSM 12112 / NCTC 10651 / 9901) TaxID=519441 RepID=D1AXU4_STRM9|nr:aminotransferase class I/II-fold pyridoxal phosphate-dependent enzyme [Streptobacillus moniliformis]ACZ01120.1 aminotransferase class I and II [Streptobacillus moniliformis DSM 12112]AVL42514.1 aminotransferase class V-fold PLP-dependent enzyme [Streptobacillus moniliformis]SQA13738.1 Putative aminotransferase A [Streptobacillus moniliformis]